ncbi:Hypothetical predicted protein, partial [Pelobates cultripes]
MNRTIQRSFQHFRHLVHEHGNKCSRLLANLLKRRRTHLYISKIKDPSQRMHHLPDQISTTFLNYYRDLYNIQKEARDAAETRGLNTIHTYLASAGLRQLTDPDRELLDAPIAPEEISIAIKKAQTGKSPGPDGLPLQYYKTFQSELLPKLHK